MRPLAPSSSSILIVALAVLLCSGDAPAQELEPSLLPLAGLHRPVPIEIDDDEEPRLLGCATRPLLPVSERLPFGPGETVSYDVAVFGVRTGKVHLRVAERTEVDGVGTYPLHAQARSDGFLAVLGEFDARMVSYFDPGVLLPVRMVNRVVVKKPFQRSPAVSREDGAFAAARIQAGTPRGGNVNARLSRQSADGSYQRKARLKSSAEVVDMLSVIYYLRSRVLEAGTPLCFELYHRRRLWRVEGTVGGIEVVRAPLGARRTRRLDATVTRIGGKDKPPPRPVTVWMTDDAHRFPLLVKTVDKVGDIEVRALAYQPGRRLVETSTPSPTPFGK